MAQKQVASGADHRRSSTPEKVETLNFKVPAEFKKEYKGYAVAQGMSMIELLREGFKLSKARRSR